MQEQIKFSPLTKEGRYKLIELEETDPFARYPYFKNKLHGMCFTLLHGNWVLLDDDLHGEVKTDGGQIIKDDHKHFIRYGATIEMLN